MNPEPVDLVDYVATKNLDLLNQTFAELMALQTDQKMKQLSQEIGTQFQPAQSAMVPA